jgi:Niemann-Pick C1 N terminus
MCGSHGSLNCSPMKFFSNMGDAKMDEIPFQMNFVARQSHDEIDGYKAMHPKVVPCSESVDVRKFN